MISKHRYSLICIKPWKWWTPANHETIISLASFIIKGTWSQNLISFLCHNLNDYTEKEPFTRFCGVLISVHEVKKLRSFDTDVSDMYKTFHPRFSLRVFANCMEKEPFIQFYGRLNFFSWTYGIVKFWMIKWCHTREWICIIC